MLAKSSYSYLASGRTLIVKNELIEEQFRKLKSADDLEVWSEDIFENMTPPTHFFAITTIGYLQQLISIVLKVKKYLKLYV